MTPEQKQAYDWAKNQNYTSVAAQYAKVLAGLADELQDELTRVKPPCEVGAIVQGKNGKWSGEVTEISLIDEGWFLYVDYGNGYRNLHRPDEVLFLTRKGG